MAPLVLDEEETVDEDEEHGHDDHQHHHQPAVQPPHPAHQAPHLIIIIIIIIIINILWEVPIKKKTVNIFLSSISELNYLLSTSGVFLINNYKQNIE